MGMKGLGGQKMPVFHLCSGQAIKHCKSLQANNTGQNTQQDVNITVRQIFTSISAIFKRQKISV